MDIYRRTMKRVDAEHFGVQILSLCISSNEVHCLLARIILCGACNSNFDAMLGTVIKTFFYHPKSLVNRLHACWSNVEFVAMKNEIVELIFAVIGGCACASIVRCNRKFNKQNHMRFVYSQWFVWIDQRYHSSKQSTFQIMK